MDFATAFHSAAENTTDERTRELALNLAAVHERIDEASVAAGREDRPQLIVVTKYFPASDVRRLHELGVRHIGENKDQEAGAKAQEVGPLEELTWHFIGQLQSNKAKSVVRYADWVHSADRVKIVNGLHKAMEKEIGEGHREQPLNLLLQVDLRDPVPEDGRGGCSPKNLKALAEAAASSPHLRLSGLMAVAPLGEEPEPAFARLATIAEDLRADHPGASMLSAGMSQDLEAAVAHGATHLRIGRDVLGERPYR